jgi:glutaredoxin-like protein NrdH
MKAITVYTTPSCSQCTLTKKWLDDPKRGNLKGQYNIVDLSQDPQAYEAVKALGYASAPVVIMNINGDLKDEKHWYGFRPDNLEEFAPLALTLVAA